jgi:hypothetical protein
MQDERFRIEKRTYDNQYAQLYFCRLLKMAPRLKDRMQRAWPGVQSESANPLKPLHLSHLTAIYRTSNSLL